VVRTPGEGLFKGNAARLGKSGKEALGVLEHLCLVFSQGEELGEVLDDRREKKEPATFLQ